MRTDKIPSGQALVEFALIFPVLFLLMMGLFDIGRAIFYYSTLNTAVREGTRVAIVQPYSDLNKTSFECQEAESTTDVKICDEITNTLFTDELSDSTITINRINVGGDPSIEIDIEFVFEPITPGVALMGDLTMHVNSQMLLADIAKP